VTLRLKVTLEIDSDFHLGTGAGRGRTVDATVLRDGNGAPYVPASSLKGLTRWHAEGIAGSIPTLMAKAPGPAGEELTPLEELFGKEGGTRGRVDFGDARASGSDGFAPVVHGHSTRDRRTGRSSDKRLYFAEDSAAVALEAVLTSQPGAELSRLAVLLLILALRRVEAVGGQRRRGKGRTRVTVQVEEGPAGFKGRTLPDADPANRRTFEDLYRELTEPANEAASGPGACETLDGNSRDRGSARSDDALGAGIPSPPFASATETGQAPSESDAAPSAEDAAATGALAMGNAAVVDWKALIVVALARLPLVLGHDQGVDNIISTLDYIPGSTVRGAIATLFLGIRGWKPGEDRFSRVFVREHVQFGPLYPMRDGWASNRTMSMPAPHSFQTCKDHPGIIAFDAAPAHGMADLLASGAPRACGQCDAPLQALGGYLFLEQARDNLSHWRHWEPPIQTVLRTAIDGQSERAAKDQLYATQSIPRGTWFVGYLWGRRQALDELAKEWDVSDPVTLHVGKCQTRGHGEIVVWLREANNASDAVYPLVYPRPTTASPAIGETPVPPGGFTITCYSDVIALDRALRPISRLDAEALWWLLGGQGEPPIVFESGFVKSRQACGFNGAPGVPRTSDLALAAGSTWRFAWQNSARSDETGKAWALVVKAHREGLGLRRGEGFGRVLVNLPWHTPGFSQFASGAQSTQDGQAPPWASNVEAEVGSLPKGIYATEGGGVRHLVRAVHPSPLRSRCHEDFPAVAGAVSGVRRAPEAASRWLYQASRAVGPLAMLANLLRGGGRAASRPEKDALVEFRTLVEALEKNAPKDLDDLRRLLRDVAEALAETAAAQRQARAANTADEGHR